MGDTAINGEHVLSREALDRALQGALAPPQWQVTMLVPNDPSAGVITLPPGEGWEPFSTQLVPGKLGQPVLGIICRRRLPG